MCVFCSTFSNFRQWSRYSSIWWVVVFASTTAHGPRFPTAKNRSVASIRFVANITHALRTSFSLSGFAVQSAYYFNVCFCRGVGVLKQTSQRDAANGATGRSLPAIADRSPNTPEPTRAVGLTMGQRPHILMNALVPVGSDRCSGSAASAPTLAAPTGAAPAAGCVGVTSNASPHFPSAPDTFASVFCMFEGSIDFQFQPPLSVGA